MTRVLLFCLSFSFLPAASYAQQGYTLEQCVQLAEQNNLTVLDRAYDVQLAMADKELAIGSFIPSLNGFATHGYNWGRVIDPFTNTFANDRVRTNNLGVAADVILFQGFRNQHQLDRSKTDIEVSETALEAAKVQLRTSVVDNFLRILDLKERLKMSRIQLGRSIEQLADITARVDAGVLARGELFDLQSQKAQEEFNVEDLSGQLQQAKLSLIQLMQLEAISLVGFDVQAPDITAVDVEPVDTNIEAIMTSAKENFPAYQQAVLSERSAELGAKWAEAGRYPTLSMRGSLGSGYSGRNAEIIGEPILSDPFQIGTTSSGEGVFSQNVEFDTQTKSFGNQLSDNFNQSLSVSLSVPIFNGFSNKVAIDQARLRQAQASNQTKRTEDQLQVDVQNALVLQQTAYKQFRAAQTAYESAEAAYEFAVQRAEQGVIPSFQLRLSKADLDRTLAQMVNTKYRAVLAKKYLDILQGKPLTL